MANSEKPPISDWTLRAADSDSAMPDRARWLNETVWACEINPAPGHGYAWIVWDQGGADILAEDTAPTQEEAERACDAAAVQWYALPAGAPVVQ